MSNFVFADSRKCTCHFSLCRECIEKLDKYCFVRTESVTDKCDFCLKVRPLTWVKVPYDPEKGKGI